MKKTLLLLTLLASTIVAKANYTLTLYAEGCDTPNSFVYASGQQVNIAAEEIDGYQFVQWSDGNTDNPRLVTVTNDVTYMAKFQMITNGQCGDDLYWNYSQGVLTITGSGAMYDYTSSNSSPWNHLRDSITTINFPTTITSIGNYAFNDCSGLTSVTIPNSVKTIGEGAFVVCTGLTSVTIGNSVTTIGDYAFSWCNLTRVTLNSNAITGTTYSSSNNLTHIFGSQVKTYIIGNDIYSIGEYAFYGSDKITNLIFGSNLTTIGESAFANCNRIDTMTIYAVEPPIITETTFKNVSRYAFLYVPQSSERKYKTDAYWSYFDIQTISAKDTPISGDEVVILPSTDNATFTWPANDQAAGYSIEITKDGVVFCTLKFNAQGQLTGIAFAPSRGAAREMAAAEMTASGWQFTVTGLNQASKYGYTIDALNASQQSIKHYEGEFTTTGATGLEQLTIDNAQCTIRKMIIDNQLFIFRGDKIYNAAGVLMK